MSKSEMIPKTLTPVERLILANQYEILARLATSKREQQTYLSQRELVEDGYQFEYVNLFESQSPELPASRCGLVYDTLQMFHHIEILLENATEEELTELNRERLTFRGFDQEEPSTYLYGCYLSEQYGNFKGFSSSIKTRSLPGWEQQYGPLLAIYKQASMDYPEVLMNQSMLLEMSTVEL